MAETSALSWLSSVVCWFYLGLFATFCENQWQWFFWSLKAVGSIYWVLLCARRCTKHFACMITFKAFSNPMGSLLVLFRPETEQKNKFRTVTPWVSDASWLELWVAWNQHADSSLARLLLVWVWWLHTYGHGLWTSQGRMNLLYLNPVLRSHPSRFM